MSTTPHRLDKYEFRQFLGKGNIGEVWKAYDLANKCDVAIKTIYADLQRADAQFLTRFMTDGQVLVALRHPHLVSVLEVNVTRQEQANTIVAYLTMDYIVGQTLATYLQQISSQGKIPSLLEINYVLTCLGRALDQAEHRGIAHGNLTPSNILLNQQQKLDFCGGEPLLVDTGLAQILSFTPATHSKMPFYLSPEQVQGEMPSQRSDVYSLGVILYELFTGQLPFQGESSAAIMSQHINVQPTPPALINAHVSPAISEVILRALAKDPTTRYSNALLLANALTDAGIGQQKSRYSNDGIVPVRQENSFLGVAYPPSTPVVSASLGVAYPPSTPVVSAPLGVAYPPSTPGVNASGLVPFYRPSPPSSGGLIKPAFISPTSAISVSRTQSSTTNQPSPISGANTPLPPFAPLLFSQPQERNQSFSQAAHSPASIHAPDPLSTPLPSSQPQAQELTVSQAAHLPTSIHAPDPLSTPLPSSRPQAQKLTFSQAAHLPTSIHAPDPSSIPLPFSQLQAKNQSVSQAAHLPTSIHAPDPSSTPLPLSQSQEQKLNLSQAARSPASIHAPDPSSTPLPLSQSQEQKLNLSQAARSPTSIHAPDPSSTPLPLSQVQPQVTSQSCISQAPQAPNHIHPDMSFPNQPLSFQLGQLAPNANCGLYPSGLNQQVSPLSPLPTLQSTPTISSPLSQVQEQRKKISPFVYVGLIAAILIIVVGGVISIPLLLNLNKDNKANTVMKDKGHIFFQDGMLHNDQLHVMLKNASNPPNGKTYFVWLLGSNQNTKALGAITTQNGAGTLTYQEDKQRTNLISILQSVVITAEDSGTTPQTPSDNIEYQATLNPKLSDGLKSLLYATPGLPPQQSIVAVILDTIHSIDDKAGSIVDSLHQDEALATRQVVRILELLEGTKLARSSGDVPAQYGSQLNVDIGLISPQGYLDILETQIKQLEPLVTDNKATQQHLTNVKYALDDLRSWLQEMRADGVQLLKAADLQSHTTFGIALHLKQVSADSYTGHIIPPNSSPQPVPGSAGALQAYTEAQYLATMDVTSPHG